MLNAATLTHEFKSTFIALQEHIDTYMDKQEAAVMVNNYFEIES